MKSESGDSVIECHKNSHYKEDLNCSSEVSCDGNHAEKQARKQQYFEYMETLDIQSKALVQKENAKSLKNQYEIDFTKNILRKDVAQRTQMELTKLTDIMLQVDYFKKKTNLKYDDLKELIGQMKFHSCKSMRDVISHGDQGHLFYVIIKGAVTVQIPNPSIKNRTFLWREFKRLTQWKKEEFDQRVEEAKLKTLNENTK